MAGSRAALVLTAAAILATACLFGVLVVSILPWDVALHDTYVILDPLQGSVAFLLVLLIGFTTIARRTRVWSRWLDVAWWCAGIYAVGVAALYASVYGAPEVWWSLIQPDPATRSIPFFRYTTAAFLVTLTSTFAAIWFTMRRAWTDRPLTTEPSKR